MKTSLTEITEDKAKAILKMLARKVGCYAIEFVQFSRARNEFTATVVLHSRMCYPTKHLCWNEKDKSWGFAVVKSDRMHVDLLTQMLENAANGCDITVDDPLDFLYSPKEGKMLFLKAGTTLDELLIQLDLEV